MAEDKEKVEQSGQQVRNIRVGVDEQKMATSYANGFRTVANGEEVIIDFGMNAVPPGAGQDSRPDMVFTVNNRIVMNYYTAKKMAISFAQLIQQHEKQYGEIELDAAKRRKS